MENLSKEDKEFLAQVEEELKDRYTENDEEFMKVFNLEPSTPPIMENWYSHGGRRNYCRQYNDRRYNRDRSQYGTDGDYHGNRDRGHGSKRQRGYNDDEYDRHNDYNKRWRYD